MPLTDKSKVTNLNVLQLDSSLQTVGNNTPFVDRLDAQGYIFEAHGTTVPTIGTAGYAKNCWFSKTNVGAAIVGMYTNQGTTTSCDFVLLSTGAAIPGATLAYNLISTAGNVVLTAAQISDAILDRDGGAVNRTDTTPTAALLVASVPSAQIGSAFYFYFRNVSATPGQLATIAAGAGVTLSGTPTVVAGEFQEYLGRCTNVTGGAEAVTMYAMSTVSAAIAQNIVANSVNSLLVSTGPTGVNVIFAPVGTDPSIGMTVAPKVDGTLIFGGTAGAGLISVGSSSVAQTVVIGNGAGKPTVNVAAVSTVGSDVNIATAATASSADVVSIATGATTAAGGKVVHIADGTPTGAGTNLVTIGSLANTANTTAIQGGNGATAVTVTPQTTGGIVVGAAAGTGSITVGSSSAAQTVLVANGAGTPTVDIANVSTGAVTVNVASAAVAGGVSSTVNIETGNAADTAIKQVNILTGSPQTGGNNRCVVGGPGVNTRMSINADLVHSRTPNWIASETGANNAIAGALLDANGVAVPEIGGTRVTVLLGHTIQGAAGGASTFNFNGNGAVSIKSHNDLANDIVTGYAVGAVIDLLRVGTVWADMSQ